MYIYNINKWLYEVKTCADFISLYIGEKKRVVCKYVRSLKVDFFSESDHLNKCKPARASLSGGFCRPVKNFTHQLRLNYRVLGIEIIRVD